jgi:DNA-binding MarR family transcriptional regulator
MKTQSNQLSELNFVQGSMPEIFSLITKITKNLDKFQRMVLNKTTLTPPQYSVLNTLSMKGESSLSLSQLASLSYSSRSTMTNLIDTLEKKKFVKRDPNPTDRRSLLVKLTSKGKMLMKEAPSINHIYADCCSILNPEESQKMSLLLRKVNKDLMGYLK